MKYRKKPVVIEAFQYDGDLIGADGQYYVPKWAASAFEKGIMYYDSQDADSPSCELFIKTLEGVHHVSVGDYVIKGVDGELYPCKPDIFEKTYETMEIGGTSVGIRINNNRIPKTYEDGLNDAWKAAKQLCEMSTNDIHDIFSNIGMAHVIYENTPQEVIAILQSYEDSKEIKRGDEVMNITQTRGIVTKESDNSNDEGACIVLWLDGSSGRWEKSHLTKTGRNFASQLDALLSE